MTTPSPLNIRKSDPFTYTIVNLDKKKAVTTTNLSDYLSTYLKSRDFNSKELSALKAEVIRSTSANRTAKIMGSILGAGSAEKAITVVDEKLIKVKEEEEIKKQETLELDLEKDKIRQDKLFGNSTLTTRTYRSEFPAEPLSDPITHPLPEASSSKAKRSPKKSESFKSFKESPHPLTSRQLLSLFKTELIKICDSNLKLPHPTITFTLALLEESFYETLHKIDRKSLSKKEMRLHFYENFKTKFSSQTEKKELIDKELFIHLLGSKSEKLLGIKNEEYNNQDILIDIINPQVKSLIEVFKSGNWKEGEEKELTLTNFPEESLKMFFTKLSSVFHSSRCKLAFDKLSL